MEQPRWTRRPEGSTWGDFGGLDRATLDPVLAEDPYTVGGVAEGEFRELARRGGGLRPGRADPGEPGS